MSFSATVDVASLVKKVEAELRDKQAQVTACGVQLNALRSCENDLRRELAELHEQIAARQREADYVERAKRFCRFVEDGYASLHEDLQRMCKALSAI